MVFWHDHAHVHDSSEELFLSVVHSDAYPAWVLNHANVEASYHEEGVRHGVACHLAWVRRASAFPSACDAYPTAYFPSPTDDAHDRNLAPCTHAHDSIRFSASHAHARGVPIRIPTHGFQSHVPDLRLLHNHLHRDDHRGRHDHAYPYVHVHEERHATWPTLPFR